MMVYLFYLLNLSPLSPGTAGDMCENVSGFQRINVLFDSCDVFTMSENIELCKITRQGRI